MTGHATAIAPQATSSREKERVVRRANTERSCELPDSLVGWKRQHSTPLADLPSEGALNRLLKQLEVDTAKWGQGNTKTVGKLYGELAGQESELEIWENPEGKLSPIRVTHVLRAKVCSPESFERNVFLFNTWQQFGDGRRRTRNGLLSEKLCIAEIPLENHLAEVCERAVTQEEMQRLEDSTFMLEADRPPPEYDPNYSCPLKVQEAILVEHTIEIEESASYPGLRTMYHLYTVDIICLGLPGLDFNTLEFDHGDADGHRKLKYVHAWVWLDWAQIQRYLLEGSKMKERKAKGSYDDSESMQRWLCQFDLPFEDWGAGKFLSADDLFSEIENEESQLEVWSRFDGISLLVRVVHVLQIQVTSTDPHLTGRFLLHVWQQERARTTRTVYRLVAKKLKNSGSISFKDCRDFKEVVQQVVREQLAVQMDAFFNIDEKNKLPNKETSDLGEMVGPTVTKMDFVEHRYDVEQSTSYKGLHTMYHLYTMEAEIDGLPSSDFTTIDHSHRHGLGCVNGWRWVSWQALLDSLHARIAQLERAAEEHNQSDAQLNERLCKELDGLGADVDCVEASQRVSVFESMGASRGTERFGCPDCDSCSATGRSRQSLSRDDITTDVLEETQREKRELAERLRTLKDSLQQYRTISRSDNALRFPPSMLSKMAAYTITSEDYLERQSTWRQRRSRDHEENLIMMERSVRGVITRIQSFTGGMWMWTVAAAILALSMLVRLATDITMVINGELGGNSAILSLVLSVLTFGLGLLLLAVLSIKALEAPKIHEAISAALVKRRSSEVSQVSQVDVQQATVQTPMRERDPNARGIPV